MMWFSASAVGLLALGMPATTGSASAAEAPHPAAAFDLAAMAGGDVPTSGPSSLAAPPTAEMVQVLLAGKTDLPRDFDVSCLFSMGDFLYAVGPIQKPSIHYFKREASGGLLAYGGSLAVAEKQCNYSMACPVGRRLYVLLTRWAESGVDNRLVWYGVDPMTGKPQDKGISPKLTWTTRDGRTESAGWARSLTPGTDQKNIYVATDRVILRFKIESNGNPLAAGQLAEKGVGEYIVAAPDGKWLYTMTHKPVPAIACIECKPDGDLALSNVVNLDPKWGVRDAQVRTEFAMSMTPDGKWLYAADWNSGGEVADKGDTCTTNSYLAVFQRDPATGALTLADAGCGNDSTRLDHQLANSRDLRLLFRPDGGSGFISTASGGLLRSFVRDPKTGRIGAITEFPEWDTRRLETRYLWLDNEKGLLYGASGMPFGPGAANVGAFTRAMWVAKVGKGGGLPSPAIVPVLVAKQAPTAPAPAAATADWPHWRGPSGDLKSPMRGIRKDWAGGLRKVWEVTGLSSGAHTWSAPAIQGSRLVVSGRRGFLDRFFCFDADKGGMPIWTAEIEGGEAGHFDWGSGSHAMAAIDGDRAYVSSLLGIAACISMSDGKVLWKKYIGSGMFTCSPLARGDLVMYGGGSDYWHGTPLIAYRKDTGTVAWTYGQRCQSNSSPVLAKINGREQVVFLNKGLLFSVDPRTGTAIWTCSAPDMVKVNPEGGSIPTPTIDGNIVFPGSGGCPTVQIDGNSVKELWTRFSGERKANFSGGNTLSDAVVIDGYMYRFGGSVGGGFANQPHGWLVCAEFSTGKVQWTEEVGNGSLLVVDDCLLCLTFSGNLLLVKPSPKEFTKLAEIKGLVARDLWIDRQAAKLNDPPGKATYSDLDYAPCWAPPVVARGKLYIHYSNRLTCYDLMSP
jgi:outer membrane protein assembly factor BamB